MLLKTIKEKYLLSEVHVASLFSKTEKALKEDLEGETELAVALKELLTKPESLLKILETGKDRIPSYVYNRAKKQAYTEILSKIEEIFPGEVLLKQMKSNELGFRNGISGKAGSFMLIPKNCIRVFPNLTENVINSSSKLLINIQPENEIREVEFVYHNSKIVESDPQGRDEFRIYTNNLINDKVLLNPDDIVMIFKYAEVYYLYRFKDSDPKYNELANLINSYKSGRAFAALVPFSELILKRVGVKELYDFNALETDTYLDLPIMETKNKHHKIDLEQLSVSELNDLLNSLNLFDADIDKITRKIKQIKRDSRFRSLVLDSYKQTCAITKTRISYGPYSNIQGCHIIPKGLGGGDNPRNGIALDMNIHWAFDKGMLTVDDDYTVIVHDELIEDETLSKYHGQKISLPINEKLYPDKDALKFHRDTIFGSFIKKERTIK